jgi:ABC-type antimicrobial peptide transport system permease subunit
MGTIRRKILRDLLSRKFRTFLVSASIFIGVVGVIALFTTNDVLQKQLSQDLDESKIAMLEVRVTLPEGSDPDNAAILATLNRQTPQGQALPALEGIEKVEGWAVYDVLFQRPQSETFSLAELRASYTPLGTQELEPLRLIEGQMPRVGAQEVALEKRMAELNGFKVGDSITFLGRAGQVTYTVTGLIFHPYSAGNISNSQPGPEVGIYVQFEDLNAILGIAAIERFAARYETFEQAEAQFSGFVATINEVSPYIARVPGIEDPAANQQISDANTFSAILNALAVATIVASGFLVVNVVSTIVAEQKRQIGILKSLGASERDTLLTYGGIALGYGLIGTLIGLIPGLLMAQAIIGTLAPQLDILVEGFRWSPRALGIGVLMGLLVPLGASFAPVWSASRISIMEAITDLGIRAQFGESPIARALGRLPLPISLRQAVNNIYQKRSRLILTILTLTVTIGIFMGTYAVAESNVREINSIFERLPYHILLLPNELQNQAEMEARLSALPQVESISAGTVAFVQMPGNYVNFFTGDNQVQAFGIDTRATPMAIRLNLVEGTGWDENPDRAGMAISRSLARQLGVKVGDSVPVVVGGRPYELEVIGIDANAFDALNIRWQELSAMAGYVDAEAVPNAYSVTLTTADLSEPITAFGLSENLFSLLQMDYDPAAPSVALSGDLAEALGLAVGDLFRAEFEGQALERPVGQIIPNDLLAEGASQLAPSLAQVPPLVALFGFNDLAALTGAENSGQPVPNAYYVTLEGDELSVLDVDIAISRIQSALLEDNISSNFVNQEENSTNAIASVRQVTSIFLISSLLIAAVGAIGLLTTLTISVFERQKEIGVMRSIGAGSSTVAVQFLLEGVLVGLLAWVLALPLSYALAQALLVIANLQDLPFSYQPSVALLGAVGTLSICAVASLGPALSAARKTVSDILRYQ